MSNWNPTSWGHTDNTYQPEPAYEQTPTVEETETVVQETENVVEEQPATVSEETTVTEETVSEPEPTPATTTATPTKTKESKKNPKRVSHLNTTVANRIVTVVNILQDNPSAVEVAKLMTGVRKNDTAELLSGLTDGRNRGKIADLSGIAKELTEASEQTRMAKLIVIFSSYKSGVEDVFTLLNAVAPQNNFGRVSKPSQDKWFKYAQDICEKWSDDIDVSMIEKLKL